MEMKSKVILEIEKNGKKFELVMSPKASFGEAYDACYELLTQLVEKSKQAAEKMKPKKEKEGENGSKK